MFTWLAILCCHLVCGGGRRSRHASLTQAERDPKKEKIRSPNDAWEGYLKTWDCWNSQSSQGLRPPWTPSCKGQCADARCVMAYDHKTQSFMKSRGQQKCLDKTLLWQITIISLWCCLYFSVSSTFNFAYLNFPQNANVSDNVQRLHSTRLPTSLNWYFLSHFLSSMISITFYLTIKICKYPN